MIQALIFDCFGVLATEGWLPFKEQYFGNDAALMQEAGDLIQQANAGFISHEEFVQAIARLAKVTPEQVTKMLRQNTPNEPLFAYLQTLAPQYKLGLLSNSSANWLPNIFSEAQISLFDSIVLSYEAGMAKPDPRIYELAARRLEVDPKTCIFVDDQEWYATAATEVGMQGITYHDFPQLQRDLEQVLAK